MAPASLLRRAAAQLASRSYSAASAAGNRKVVVVGAAGGIGQPLSLLMKVQYMTEYEKPNRPRISPLDISCL
jgi:5,10-methylene-tetrahydrofolate dehydrogenase/methenyl tetrahydrofolate cyclohydrolase